MPVTREEYNEIIKMVCPHCRTGTALRQRKDTGEFIHENVMIEVVIADTPTGVPVGGKFERRTGTILCWADGLRRSRFANG
jgi:hypothetical protein